jgi:hypothetical protein
VQLRLFGLQHVDGRWPGYPGSPSGATPDLALIGRARRTERLLGLVSRYGICHGSCLSRSLTLVHLLEGQGIESVLCLGVRCPSRGLEAHAWVEHHGVVLNDRDDVDSCFTPIGRSWVRPGSDWESQETP